MNVKCEMIIKCRKAEKAMKNLCLQPLEQRKRNRHINLLMEILAKEEQHLALSSANMFMLAMIVKFMRSTIFSRL